MPIWRRGITFEKDPDSTLDYEFDFAPATNGTAASDWLSSGDSISSATVVVTGGGIAEATGSRSVGTGSVQVWISGGTVGETGTVTVRMTSSQARIVDRSCSITIIER